MFIYTSNPHCKTVSTGCGITLGLDNLMIKKDLKLTIHSILLSLINLSFN
jgi:hypothetical protein